MSFPSFELVESLETMLDASLKPRFSPTEWTRIQEELLDDLAGLADRPEEVAERAVDQRLWAGHPWRLPWGGTESSLARLTPARLASWHEAQLDPSRLVLAVAGGIDPDQATRVAARWLSTLGPAAPLAPRPALRPVSRTRMSRRAGQHQALVSVSWRTAGARDGRRRAYMAAAAVLDGAAGRLFMALRERLGLGYQVWADHRAGLDGGLFTAGLTCAPDMVERAADALLHEVYQLATTGPGEDELVRVNSILAGELADGWQRASVRASFLGSGLVLGLPWRPDEITRERQAVTPAQVRDALATLTEDRSVLIRVTPR